MNREQFIQKLEQNFDKGIEIVKVKNKDYAGDTDPFKNFRSSEVIGIPVEQAILVRILDKMSRIGNVLKNGEAAVKDETVQDTILDAINYLNILLVYLSDKK